MFKPNDKTIKFERMMKELREAAVIVLTAALTAVPEPRNCFAWLLLTCPTQRDKVLEI